MVILLEIFLGGLGLAFGGGYLHARLDQAAYESAPSCDAADSGTECRGHRTATIVEGDFVGGKAGGGYWVTTNLPGLAGQRTWVWKRLWDQLSPGETVQVETWRGRISLINGVQTRDNPNDDVQNAEGLALVCAAFMVLVLIPGVPALMVVLRQRRRSSRPASAAA